MAWEIDQSGRIEETQRNTIIAIADKDFAFSVCLKSRTKRKIQKIFRALGKPKLFAIRTFACCLVVLVRKAKVKPAVLIIDIEYPGHEQTIKSIIYQHLNYRPEIRFKSVGKKSPAHKKAYFTYKKKLKVDFLIKEKEIMDIVIKRYKKRPRVLKRT